MIGVQRIASDSEARACAKRRCPVASPLVDRAPSVRLPPASHRGGPWLPARDELLGKRLRDRFRVVARRAEGGLSAVYLGADERRRDAVAIKVLHAPYAGLPAVRQRFAREAELALRLGGRIGAAGRATGLISGRPFLVLDFLDGPTVRERLAGHGRLSVEEAARTADRLLARVALLHAEGFVHHDLKPAHVLAGGTALLDLGSALPIGAPVESTGCSPAYGAPEQWRDGARADPRADLYSVGVMLFEMVTGRRPFVIDPAAPLGTWEQRDLPVLVPPRSDVDGAHEVGDDGGVDVPPALGDAVLRALAADPSARFASAEAMRAALAPLLRPAGKEAPDSPDSPGAADSQEAP